MTHDLTVKSILDEKNKKKSYRVSDFLSKEEVKELHEFNAKSHKKRVKLFNVADYLIAEIIERFGYDFYKDWKVGIITDKQVLAYLEASRFRDNKQLLHIESVIFSSLSSCATPTQHKTTPKGLNEAYKMIKKLSDSTKDRV